MKKKITLFILVSFVLILFPRKSYAAGNPCSAVAGSTKLTDIYFTPKQDLTVTYISGMVSLDPGIVTSYNSFGIKIYYENDTSYQQIDQRNLKPANNIMGFSIPTGNYFTFNPKYTFNEDPLIVELFGDNNYLCYLSYNEYKLQKPSCVSIIQTINGQINQDITVSGQIDIPNFKISLKGRQIIAGPVNSDSYGNFSFTFRHISPENYTGTVVSGNGGQALNNCSFTVNVGLLPITPNLTPNPIPSEAQSQTPSSDCGGAKGLKLTECTNCITPKTASSPDGVYESGGSWTALDCIPTDPQGFVQWLLLKLAIPTAGGIAFLIMLYGVFTIIVSSGNPEKLNQGKEMIVSAIAGLIMILFSVFLLRLIGVDILGIPGFK